MVAAAGIQEGATSCEKSLQNSGGRAAAGGLGANRVNGLHCLTFKVSEENRSKEALQECKQSRLELQDVSAFSHTHTHTHSCLCEDLHTLNALPGP